MNNDLPFVRALIDALLLLEFAGPNEIDPDTAVRGMENIKSSLLALEKSDQRILSRHLLQIAADNAQDEAYSNFVRSLPDMLGLDSE
jgi:hypothetical protein